MKEKLEKTMRDKEILKIDKLLIKRLKKTYGMKRKKERKKERKRC